MAYGSVATHGLKLVDELIASGRYNVIFRPHPRSGVSDPLYGSSVKRIKSMLESAKHSLAGPTYYYDDSPSWGWQWATADLCITDMSAVAYDWLATGKPILISRPANPQAVLDDSPALLKLPSISQQDVTNIVSSVEQLLQMPHPGFQELVDYHFGNTEAGESMKRFIVAAMKVLDTPKTQTA